MIVKAGINPLNFHTLCTKCGEEVLEEEEAYYLVVRGAKGNFSTIGVCHNKCRDDLTSLLKELEKVEESKAAIQ